MVRPKNQAKKQQKRGVDFKKIKRKIGRKLPPPNNATNTEIKFKAIILPEQSLASEKAGLAVSKKGLTLKELLQQTSHHNAKVRKDALIGIRDLFLNHPAELRLHKSAVIEKLRERIGDDDKVVRETLYQLLKSTILPGCKKDNQTSLISLMLAYIFNAITHLAIDVRLMAFKFFDLVVEYYPPSFILNAEKILQNYEDILRKNHFYLEDKGKLKIALAGLVRCLSLLPCGRREVDLCEKDTAQQGVLHAFESNMPNEPAGFADTIKKLKDLMPVLVNCFQEFSPLVQNMPVLDAQSFDCMLCILKSIDLAIKFFLYWTDKFRSEKQLSIPHKKEADVIMYEETILPVSLRKLFIAFPLNPVHQKDDDRYFILNIVITEIFLQLREWIYPPALLLDKFLEFIEKALPGKVSLGLQNSKEEEEEEDSRIDSGTRSRKRKAFCQKHILSLLPFLPKLVSQVESDRKSGLLEAFTKAFKDCRPESSKKLACLSTVEEMLIPRHGMPYLDASDPVILPHQVTWIREIPSLLNQLGDKHPLSSQAVLHLQLYLGKHALLNSALAQEYNDMQHSLIEFYSTRADGIISSCPFIGLPRESQELSICCLYYFSAMDTPILESLASCCLCPDLEPSVLFRIIEVLHCAYKAGHIKMEDHISFFITLLACFRIFPANIFQVEENDSKISNRRTFRSVSCVICSCLKQMGDSSIVFHMLEKLVVDQISQKPPLDNICALLTMLIRLDSSPSRLSEESIIKLNNILAGYLIDVMCCIPEQEDDESVVSIHIRERRNYYLPCFFLFEKSHTMLKRTVNIMGSLITEKKFADPSSTISAIVSALILMHKDAKVQLILSSCKSEIDHVLENISLLQCSEGISMTIEERHKIQCAIDRLKIVRSTVYDGMLII